MPMETIKNSFPVIGGISFPLLTISMTTVFETVIISAIGAITGLLIKELFEYYKKKKKNGKA